MPASPLLAVDGHRLLYRSWHGFSDRRIMSRGKTRDLTGVFGFLAILRKTHLEAAPGHEIVVAFDAEDAAARRAVPNPCRRHLHPDPGPPPPHRRLPAGQFGVTAPQWPDYRALTGDPVDSIRGIAGIGPKTAARLLAGGIGLEQVPGCPALTARHRQAITASWDKLLAWREIIRLNDEIPLSAGTSGPRARSPQAGTGSQHSGLPRRIPTGYLCWCG
jgi:5'-3' exonuclease